jgi:hypothetical protein
MKHGATRLGLVLAAGLIVGVSNLGAMYLAGQNRREASRGIIELTERELALAPVIGDSTVMLLELNWRVQSEDRRIRNSPDWFTAARLAELGFDCHVPATDPGARDFYRSMLPVPACVVLELRTVQPLDASDSRRETALVAIDVGRDARPLCEKYRDARFIVAKGIVSLVFDDSPDSEDPPGRPTRIRGRINQIVPNLIFVPHSHCEALQKLRSRSDSGEESPNRKPRYAVTVSWGTHGEPWVRHVRMLSGAMAESGKR